MTPKEIDHLESVGEEEVLRMFAIGQLGDPGSSRRSEAEAWLRLKELERSRANSSSAEAIAKEHLRIARQQKNIAIAAMVLSAITAIIAACIGGILSYSSYSPLKISTSISVPNGINKNITKTNP